MNRFIKQSPKQILTLSAWSLTVLLGLGAVPAHAAVINNIASLKVEDVGVSSTCDPVNLANDPNRHFAGSNGCDYYLVDPGSQEADFKSGGFQFTDKCSNPYLKQNGFGPSGYGTCNPTDVTKSIPGILWSGNLNAGTILFDGLAQPPGLPASTDPRSFTSGFMLYGTSDATNGELVIPFNTPPTALTVTPLTTSDPTPVLRGTFDATNTTTFTVSVNGLTYTLSVDPELTNAGNDWTLDLNAIAALTNGTYPVTATADGANDATTNELTIYSAAPAIPTVTARSTGDTTPVITGTFDATSTPRLTVTVAGAIYTLGIDPELTRVGYDWTLDLSGITTPLSYVSSPYSITATAAPGFFYPGVGAQGARGVYNHDTSVRDDSALTLNQLNFTGTWVDTVQAVTFPLTPDVPVRVNWVAPGANPLEKKVQIAWYHVITSAEDTSTGKIFTGLRAAWVVEGTMTLDPDTSPPVVTSTIPASGAINVPVSTSSISVTFDEPMDPATVTVGAITLTPSVTVSAPTTSDNITFVFPIGGLTGGPTAYTLAFNAGPKDVVGNALTLPANKTFTTIDLTPPTLSTTVPAADATDVVIATTITLTFNETMDATSIAGAFRLIGGPNDVAVTGTVTPVNSSTYTFTPSSALAYGSSYTATIDSVASDAAGNSYAGSTWSFTTVADPTPPTVASAATTVKNDKNRIGCSLSPEPLPLFQRGEWWLLAGFMTWLGIFRYRRRLSKKI